MWLALSSRAQTDPALRHSSAHAHGQPHGLDIDTETDRLPALLDGLALHAAIRPRAFTRDRMLGALDAHLALAGLLHFSEPHRATAP